jgi:hypothetical protein
VQIPVDSSPSDRMREAAHRHGDAVIAQRAADVLRGGGYDDELLLYLGGPHAQKMLERGDKPYWPRVWAARALLYVWDPAAASAVVLALSDEHWRVREMAAKVCLKRTLSEALDRLAMLAGDPVPRVRAAAARALGALGEAEAAEPLRHLLDDVDRDVRIRAEQALDLLSRRLDRAL